MNFRELLNLKEPACSVFLLSYRMNWYCITLVQLIFKCKAFMEHYTFWNDILPYDVWLKFSYINICALNSFVDLFHSSLNCSKRCTFVLLRVDVSLQIVYNAFFVMPTNQFGSHLNVIRITTIYRRS